MCPYVYNVHYISIYCKTYCKWKCVSYAWWSNTNWKTFLMACLYIVYHKHIIYIYTDYLQDYKGQKLAEQIFQGIILVSAVSNTDSTFTAITTLSFVLCLTSFTLQVIGFIYGLFIQQFGWTVYIMLAGFTVSCLVCHKISVCLM